MYLDRVLALAERSEHQPIAVCNVRIVSARRDSEDRSLRKGDTERLGRNGAVRPDVFDLSPVNPGLDYFRAGCGRRRLLAQGGNVTGHARDRWITVERAGPK